MLKFYPIKVHVKVWNKDSAESIEKIQNIFDDIYVVYTEKDNIVRGLSHLYKYIDTTNESNVKIIDDKDQANHLPNWELIANLFSSSN